MNPDMFTASGVTSQTTLNIPHGPWPIWGQPILSYANANPMPSDRGAVTYQAWIRVTRNPLEGAALTDPTSPESYKTGDSYVDLPPDRDCAFRLGAGGRLGFVLAKPNSVHRLAYLQLEPYKAATIDDALALARVAVNSAALMFTVQTKLPLYWDGIIVQSNDKMQIRMEYRSPRPSTPFSQPDGIWMQASLVRFAQVFAEGLRSESPFYRFLSFFKVAQQFNSSVRAQLRKLCEKHDVVPPTLNGALPEDPIKFFAAPMVGTKYTKVITDYQELYRNSIAHLDAGDKVLPFDLTVEGRVRTASMVLGYIVEDQLNQIAVTVKALQAKGLSDTDIVFG